MGFNYYREHVIVCISVHRPLATLVRDAEVAEFSFAGVSAANEKRYISLRSRRLERSPAGAGQAGGNSLKLKLTIYDVIYFMHLVVKCDDQRFQQESILD